MVPEAGPECSSLTVAAIEPGSSAAVGSGTGSKATPGGTSSRRIGVSVAVAELELPASSRNQSWSE